MRSFLAPLVANPSAPLRLAHADGAPIGRLEPAFDSASRNRGLLGRDHLDPGVALAIAPCNAIHTFFMQFPIDVIFVARDGRVLKVRAHLRPWRISAAWGAFATIEMAAGQVMSASIVVGSQLVVC